MLGIIIAVLIGIYKYVFVTQVWEVIYLSLTHFLFWWYIITSGIMALIVVAVATYITAYGAEIGSEMGESRRGMIIGRLLGFTLGGALSLLMMTVFVIACGLKIGGVYLLSTAVTLTEQGYVWNTKILVFGAIALLLGLIMSKVSYYSSSKSSR